jgi:hypothetical protein
MVTDYFPNTCGLKTDIKVLKTKPIDGDSSEWINIQKLELLGHLFKELVVSTNHWGKVVVLVHQQEVRCSAILPLMLIGKTKGFWDSQAKAERKEWIKVVTGGNHNLQPLLA